MINRDRNGVKKYIREHNYDNMAKRNRAYHDQFRKELVKADKDRKREGGYKSKSGYDGTNIRTIVLTCYQVVVVAMITKR